MDNGFTFAGRHNSELGTAFLVTKWPGSPPMTINDTTVSGRDGTIRYPGQTFGTKPFEGNLYILDPDDELLSDTRMMERVREIVAWLQHGGQQKLILDAEPDVFYMAEIVQSIDFTTSEWENGSTALRFVLQPFAYSNHETSVQYTLAANVSQTKMLMLSGNRPAPIKALITVQAAMTWIQIVIGSALIRLQNMALVSGDAILIDADVAKSEVATVAINGDPSRGYVTDASAYPLFAQPGANTVAASADGACTVAVSARGRWK